MRHIVRSSSSAIAVLLCGVAAQAAGRDCNGVDSLKDKPTVEAGKVVGHDAKTVFVKGETEDKACPADMPACRRKAFLVPGNSVVVSGRTGDFVCATYVNGKGVETSGWLPKAAIAIATPSEELPWPGTWIRDEAKITIKADGKGLAVHGDATWGMHDPDRVKRGGVNIGEIAAKVVPEDHRLSFATEDNTKTLPVDKGDEFACRVWMQRVGDYLLVDDNNKCGGMNVSFRGTYVRR